MQICLLEVFHDNSVFINVNWPTETSFFTIKAWSSIEKLISNSQDNIHYQWLIVDKQIQFKIFCRI